MAINALGTYRIWATTELPDFNGCPADDEQINNPYWGEGMELCGVCEVKVDPSYSFRTDAYIRACFVCLLCSLSG